MEQFLKIVDGSDPKVIFDVGSRDGSESVTFKERYKGSSVYAFECNPQTIPQLRERAAKYGIHAVEKAVNIYDGETTFYPINPKETVTTWMDGNPGASSLFKANGNYPAEVYVQDEIKVPCTRLDSFCYEQGIKQVDVLWIDLQGAELIALNSLGELLKTVKFINTEVTFKEMYSGQVLFDELHAFLVSKGFTLINDEETFSRKSQGFWQTDGIYTNQKLSFS